MKTKFNILLGALCLLLFYACTNNGDIGPLYGQWQLQTMTVDGREADIDCGEFTISFQNHIIMIKKSLPNHDYINYYGTWDSDGHTLTLNFTHSDKDEDNSYYNPPSELGIPSRQSTPMTIERLTSSDLVFWFVNEEGETLSYGFKKLK